MFIVSLYLSNQKTDAAKIKQIFQSIKLLEFFANDKPHRGDIITL